MSSRMPWAQIVLLFTYYRKTKFSPLLLTNTVLEIGSSSVKKWKHVPTPLLAQENSAVKGNLSHKPFRWHNHLDPSVSKNTWTLQ